MTDQTRAAREVALPELPDNDGSLTVNGYLGMCIEIRERQLRAKTVELNRAKDLLTWAKQWIPLEGREPVDAFLNPESLKGEKNDDV